MDPRGLLRRIPLRPHQLRERRTPTADLFVLAHLGVPLVDAADWWLELGGLVRRARRFTLDDLRRRPKREIEAFHECCGNPMAPTVPQRRIANVVWGGVELRTLIDEAGADGRASFVWSYGLDGGEFGGHRVDRYCKDLPLWRVAAGEVLVAYELNGEPLPAAHGFPARLLVPGWYGTNSVKWLWRIRLADRRADGPFTTVFYNDRPGAPVWAVAPESVIVSPAPEERVRAGAGVDVWGWCWADSGVRRVDVSADGGATWEPADVEPRRGWSWQRFGCTWRPRAPGATTLLSRATAPDGTTQPADGARSAVHAVPVTVV
jgi:sulfane dehydrogenase subunit SoxC